MREQKKIYNRTGIRENKGNILIVFFALFCAFLNNSCEKSTTYVGPEADPVITTDITPPLVSSVTPADNAVSIAKGTNATVTFSEKMSAGSITSSTFILKQGATSIPGTVSGTGALAVFTPTSALTPNTLYSCTITTGVKDSSGNALLADYTWSFTTAADPDTQKPTVLSVGPVNNATAVPTNSKVTITFSKPMNASSINASTVTLKKGTTAVTGTVAYSGTTATFAPSSALDASSVYTCTVTTGVKDAAGNTMASNYTWSFTTANTVDVTPPTVSSVVPASNATSVATGSKVTATFSEIMDASTVNTSTFTLKQGSSVVAGTVSYTGTTATFTPTTTLAGSTLYTGTITTGTKDPSGNALAASYTWSFTTVAAASGKSFATDVMPILNLCNTCHTHGWTPSSNASAFYTNLVNAGYVKPATPASSKIYTKLSGGHPPSTVSAAQVSTILTWMTEGSKNN